MEIMHREEKEKMYTTCDRKSFLRGAKAAGASEEKGMRDAGAFYMGEDYNIYNTK